MALLHFWKNNPKRDIIHCESDKPHCGRDKRDLESDMPTREHDKPRIGEDFTTKFDVLSF
ncbi:hypothetical protein SAMN05518872_107169 [Psychrobacillus sp. OK032]|nr:hypothetical protein SAMN05518872_107169 [Psychrobacillus sp. OK032]